MCTHVHVHVHVCACAHALYHLLLQSVAEAHASLSLPTTSTARMKHGGRWGHRTTGSTLPLPPPTSPPNTTTTTPHPSHTHTSTEAPPPRDFHPTDDFFSSSDEADSDSPFPNSSDSEPEPAAFHPTENSSELAVEGGVEEEEEEEGTGEQRPQSKRYKPETKLEVPDGWTGSEVTCFRMVHPIFGHNYCAMAEMIQTKSCRQLFEYGREVSMELLEEHGNTSESQQPPSKKKKRNMR